MTGPAPTGSDTTRFFGGCLLAAGVLMALLCGLCTLVVVGSSLGNHSSPEFSGVIVVALIFGGIPVATGVALILIGRGLLRERKPASPEKTAKDFE